MAPLHERMADARDRFMRAGISPAEAALDAELLARHVLDCDRATLVIRARDPLPSAFGRLYDELIARRLRREPVAYIIGRREFWGLDFEVSPAVLIPRPETECIVEEALTAAPRRDRVRRIIDVGTGSGCLAVVLAIEFGSAAVVGTDSSPAALEVARRNAERHSVENRVSFVETDLLPAMDENADMIVSNPPYVPSGDAEHLQPEVAHYEPASALYAGADGMTIICRLFAEVPACLADGGALIVEFGFTQEKAVAAAAERAGWTVERVRPDLQGIPRVAVLRR